LPTVTTTNGHFSPTDFLFDSSLRAIGGQFAILSVPQMSATLQALNEDSDAEFLANPRVVTADNQQAKIEILRNQPVPQLNFNEQTATAVFGGFQDKTFGNTLVVRPSINKDNFITLSVKPEISNKVSDFTFTFSGATVASPIIDKRTLDSNVLIKSGNTLAIGGLLSDQVSKARTKIPVLGDIPLIGYAFQSHDNERHKRNLLVFVTPTILDQRYGTGLEDQVSGLHHVGEEYADPNGWRNNAKGAVRLVPTSNRQLAADYAKPGVPPPPEEAAEVQFKSSVKDRDF
jgi:general secretion pathway protein D